MKKLSVLLAAVLVFSGDALMAQETVAPKVKKLQQLYLTIGTGPALTNNKKAHRFGGLVDLSFTSTLKIDLVLRTGVMRSRFATIHDWEPGLFSYLNHHYTTNYTATQVVNSIYLEAGKKKTLYGIIQVQTLGGLSFNRHTQPTNDFLYLESSSRELNLEKTHKFGLLVQTEVMFLPSRFAGLTLGSYYHYVPKISNGGISLSLNLGLLR